MKNKVIAFVISIVLAFSLVACGNTKVEDIEVTTESAEKTEKTDSIENKIENAEDIGNKEVQEIDLNLNEYQFTFEDRNITKNNEYILKDSDFTELYETVTLTDSVDLYIDADICIGYTKPNVSVSLMAKYDNWYLVSIGDSIKYAKADEVDAVTLKETEEVETVSNDEVIETTPTQEIVSTITPNENVSVENNTVINPEPESIQESSKYTPEEAVSVYRSAMEAGGLAWDPSLKNGGSWGTGWIYLDKGYPEWCASTSLESYSIGSNGKPWTKYYLEVTGSDDSAVYITEWHN